ncbi:MAG TPA: serine hydrolase domain-containing protein, partial [Rudaea sp.]|nr:serine hydrolase domain-containing protein [Rudaea sp.]
MFHLRTPAALALLAYVLHVAAADARDVREHWVHRRADQGVHVSRNPKAVAKEFDGWMDQIEQSGQISGMAAAIVKDDSVLLQRGIGYADASRGEHVTVDSPFRLASLSKAFASALTAMLVDEGMLNWETRVAGVLPTFELKNIEASDKLTVEDILSQRVGLPHNTYDRLLEQDEPYEELVDKLRDVPMTCDV